MATFYKLLPVLGLLAATACTSVDHGLGEAVKYDMAMQTIDPDPVYPPGGAQPGDNAEVGVGAVRRYLQGTVKEVVPATTTTSATGGSGSSTGPK
jgi:hypothetical protein